jgi:hypothetical protein
MAAEARKDANTNTSLRVKLVLIEFDEKGLKAQTDCNKGYRSQ